MMKVGLGISCDSRTANGVDTRKFSRKWQYQVRLIRKLAEFFITRMAYILLVGNYHILRRYCYESRHCNHWPVIQSIYQKEGFCKLKSIILHTAGDTLKNDLLLKVKRKMQRRDGQVG